MSKMSLRTEEGKSRYTQPDLSGLFCYHPESGDIIWLKHQKNNQVKVGSVAGAKNKSGHIMIGYAGRRWYAHRLAWFLYYGEWPRTHIDHINGNPLDNRITNLRLATQSQNMMNKRKLSSSRGKFKGITWHNRNKKWVAQIKKDGKNTYLGSFPSQEEAHAKYREVAQIKFGEFART